MADQEKDDEKAAASDNKKSPAAKEGADASKKGELRLKLKRILGYAMLGLAPALAVIALVVAAIAMMGNQSGRAQISKDAAAIASLEANLSASKLELEKLKTALSAVQRDAALQNEKSKKQEERMAKVIQNITPLQVKLKISPTLEAQLLQPASGVAIAPVSPVAPAVAPRVLAPPVHEVKPAKPTKPVKPVKPVEPSVATPPPASTSTPAAKTDKPPLSPQVKAMKDAIERFNKQ